MAEYNKNCLNCGKEFVSKRSDARFCGSVCRSFYGRVVAVDGGATQGDDGEGSHQPTQAELMAEILDELRSIKNIILNQGERLLTVEGTCRELDISKPTFDRLHSEGVIKVHRFGGKGTTGRGRKPYILFSELVDVLRSDEFLK